TVFARLRDRPGVQFSMSMVSMESEYQTRRRRIDPLLTSQGWNIIRSDLTNVIAQYPHHAVTEYPTANGPADYALFVDNQLLGIVEAKKVTLGPQNVLTQAERYSRGVTDSAFNFNGCHVPFLYSTNGEVLWFHDVRHPLNRSRRISGFHTANALTELLGRDLESSNRARRPRSAAALRSAIFEPRDASCGAEDRCPVP